MLQSPIFNLTGLVSKCADVPYLATDLQTLGDGGWSVQEPPVCSQLSSRQQTTEGLRREGEADFTELWIWALEILSLWI